MTPTTHTPGPWTVTEHLNILGADGIGVANAQRMGDWPLATANARLIAKAPEMREELSEMLDLVRALIDQKALGEIPHIPDGGASLRLECHDRIAHARALLAEIEGGRS